MRSTGGGRLLAVSLALSTGWIAGCDRGGAGPIAVPSDGLTVQMTGGDYEWHILYPGPDGELHTGDDIETLRHLHVPADVETTVHLTSRDYLYSLKVPEFAVKEVAVPDLTMTWTLPPTSPGTYELKGDQLCGYSHENLIGNVVVQKHDDFVRWLESRRDGGG
jgi:heme/copper-type cytochrome/quinol oxidase subunit 2